MPFDQTNYQPEPIGRQRLRILADFLPSVPSEKFNICQWAACACGWAATIPEFKAAGLRVAPWKVDASISTMCFGDRDGGDAVEAFFDLNHPDVVYLFSMFAYDEKIRVTPATVAARIREYLAQTADASSAVRAA